MRELNEKNVNKSSDCVGCGKTRIDVNIWGSEYDMSMYMGRARHYFKMYSPCHFFSSEAKLENARKIVERYR